MQKLDYVTALGIIINELDTREILYLTAVYTSTGRPVYNRTRLENVIIQSYSNYKKIKNYKNLGPILNSFEISKYYKDEFIVSILEKFRDIDEAGKEYFIQSRRNSIFDKIIYEFIEFHNNLLKMYSFGEKVLLSDKLSIIQDSNNVIVFQVFNSKDRLPTELYITILSRLNNLAKTLSRIVGVKFKFDLFLLDSGSNTNFAFETFVKIAGPLFNFFKELWEFHKNREEYNKNREIVEQERKYKKINNSLAILETLKNKADTGVISREEAFLLRESVKSDLTELTTLNVWPKNLTETESTNQPPRLPEGPEIKQLIEHLFNNDPKD